MIKKNLLFSTLASVLRLILGLATFMVLTQYLDIESFGLYAYLLVLTGYLSITIDFGFNLSSFNEIPKQITKIRDICYCTVKAKFLLTIVFCSAFYIYYTLFEEQLNLTIYTVFIAIAILQSFISYYVSIFKSVNKFEVDLYIVFVTNILPLIVIYFYRETMELPLLANILLASRLIALLWVVIFFEYSFRNYLISRYKFKIIEKIKNNMPYALNSVIAGIFASIDVYIMNRTLGQESVAIYSAGMKVFVALVLMGDIINSAFMPKLSALYNNMRSFTVLFKKQLMLVLVLCSCVSLGILFLGPKVVEIIYREEFYALKEYTPYFALAIMVKYLSSFLGGMLTISNNQTIRTKTISIVFVVHILLNVFLQNEFGILGAITSMIISYLILTVIYFTFNYKRVFNR